MGETLRAFLKECCEHWYLLPLAVGNIIYFVYWACHPDLTEMQMFLKMWYVPVVTTGMSLALGVLLGWGNN